MSKINLFARVGTVAAMLALAGGCGSLPERAPVGDLMPSLLQLPSRQVDNFEKSEAEGWVTDDPSSWQVVNGQYVALTKDDMATAAITYTTTWSNLFVEADYARESGSVGAGGLVLRASPDFKGWAQGSGYLFGIGSDGVSWQAAVFRQIDGVIDYVLAWTNIPAFAAGTNHLGVLARNDLLQFYLNGVLFWEGYDKSLASGGIGLFASTSPGFETVHEFDAFSVKEAELSVVVVTNEEAAAAAPEAKPEKEKKKSKKEEKAAVESKAERTVQAVPDAGPDRSPILRPGFLVRVSVLVSGKREIDAEVKRVSDNNILELPLVGPVPVEGVSLRKLNEILQTRYAEFFINPQVVAEFVVEERPDAISPWGSVVVLGRVRTPGRVNIPPTQDLTVSGAIQQAGGLDTSARTSAIRLTRKKDDGKTERITIDFTAVGQHGELENDLLLKPGDLIFVPERIF